MQNLFLEKRKILGVTRKDFSDALGLSREQEKRSILWDKGVEEPPLEIIQKIQSFPTEPRFKCETGDLRTIDLFAGIGGIRLAFQNLGCMNVFSSEWNESAKKTYYVNFGDMPAGDITQISESEIPDHDILLAGFPCQPFSQAGLKKGFEDTRGTMFFHIARILKEKRPRAFLLENVKQLRGHDKGKTLSVILNVLEELDYYVPDPVVLNAVDFGIPQHRERLIIVGFDRKLLKNDNKFSFPEPLGSDTRVGDILEENVDFKYTISDRLYAGHLERRRKHAAKGNGFGFCAFKPEDKYVHTISARYAKDGSEALIEQENANPRMLTPRECARLQGFPDDYVIPVSNAQSYKQFGNSVCIPVIQSVAGKVIEFIKNNMD